MIRYARLPILLIMISACLAPLLAHAQTQRYQAVVINAYPKPGDDSLGLSVFFTLKDERGFPVAKDAVKFEEGSVLQLLGGDSPAVPVEPKEPTTPIKVALVLDASGSMSPYMAQVREAAKQAVDTAPENTLFAVFRFTRVAVDQSFDPIQPFTADRNLVKLAIDAVQSEPNGVTCLYNATFKALDALDAATDPNTPERRAMLLFTDGKDDNGQGGPCSNWSNADAVKAKAKASPNGTIPIHTVGLCTEAQCGNINRGELDLVAQDTFGYSAIGPIESMNESFKKIMDGLRSQWVVEANVYPCNQTQGVLALKTNLLAEHLTGSFSFTPDRCYSPPVPPANANITGPVDGEQGYTFEIGVNSAKPETVQAVDVLVSFPSNALAYSETLEFEPAKTLTVVVPKDRLTQSGEYKIEVRARSASGAIRTQSGDIELATKQFGHTIETGPNLPTAAVSVGTVEKTETQEFLPVAVAITDESKQLEPQRDFLNSTVRIFYNGSEIETYSMRGFDLDNSQIRVPLEPGTLQANQEYEIVVEIQAPGLALIKSSPYKFSPKLPAPPTFWQAYIRPVISNPFVIGGILLVICLVAVVLIYTARPKKSSIPAPIQSKTMLIPSPPPVEAKPSTPPRSANAGTVPNSQPGPQPPRNDVTELAPELSVPRVKVTVVQTVDPAQQGQQLVTTFPCVVGRVDADLVVPDDKKVSRRHAEIYLQNGKLTVKDLNSVNGTAFVVPDPKGGGGAYAVKTQLERGGAAEWDNRSLLRLGRNTVLALEFIGSGHASSNATQLGGGHGDETRLGS